MNILVVSSNYPSLQNPNYGAFVYNLMQELAKGNQLTVISPIKLHEVNKPKQDTYGPESCNVRRPIYLSLGNRKFGFIHTLNISSYFYRKSVERALLSIEEKPNVIYAHFIRNAISVLDYAGKNNIPIVVASGESNYDTFERLSDELKVKLIKNIKQIISVSNENKQQLIDLGFNENIITVIPNAVNYDLFKPLDKRKCKEKLELQPDKFIVGFIGHFTHRKGPNRIIKAIKKLNDKNIELVCIGSQGELLDNNFTTIIPPVPNFQLAQIYNAFDVFVLPTLHEGSCNVIEEAKACCIPIISSKGTSVEEQILHNETGVLIDPLNIDKIASSINNIKINKEFRDRLIYNNMKRIDANSIQKRAERINALLLNLLN